VTSATVLCGLAGISHRPRVGSRHHHLLTRPGSRSPSLEPGPPGDETTGLLVQEYLGDAPPEVPAARLALSGDHGPAGVTPGAASRLAEALADLERDMDRSDPIRRLPALPGNVLIAYVDPVENLFLYRSVLSMETLYYRVTERALTWATDPTRLFPVPGPQLADVDRDVLCATILDLPPGGDRTVFAGVEALAPGHVLRVGRQGEVEVSRLDRLFPAGDNTDLPLMDAGAELRRLTGQAVRRSWSMGRFPGLLLNGGVDSAVLAMAAAEMGSARPPAIHVTCSSVAGLETGVRQARLTAGRLGMPLEVIDLAPEVAPGGCLLGSAGSTAGPLPSRGLHLGPRLAGVASSRGLDLLLASTLGPQLMHGGHGDLLRSVLGEPRLRGRLGGLVELMGMPGAGMLAELGRRARPPDRRQSGPIATGFLVPAARRRALQAAWDGGGAHLEAGSAGSRHALDSCRRLLAGEGRLETALRYQLWYPNRVRLEGPLLDRDLVEFALSLGPRHRSLAAGGQRLDVVAWRLAGLGQLPAEVVSRRLRPHRGAFAEAYLHNNARWALGQLGPGSLLAELGLIEPGRVAACLRPGQSLGPWAFRLICALRAEAWLRALAGHPAVAGTART
jgi:hypothetical protein